ncbi:MAG TPA: protein phosphatase 2C domain-containing protein [Blastocatellia bacterium]|nr:protein phosphatase 2C domain-containing protein [Blastocatellia bacterium]
MSTPKFTVGSVTDRGLNPRRTANEDRFLALPESGLFLVADGVGGHRGGQVASQTAVDVFTEVFAEQPAGDLLTTLKQTIIKANESIYKASHELAELEGMASTLALVAIEGMRAVIAHVGDSRVYRFDGRKLYCETEDHSEVNDAVRAGTLTAVQAAHHPHRNIINRALGADATVEADFKVLTLEARTSFLLCSDGITRHIPDDELETILKSGHHPNNICARLKEICFTRGAEDNLTAVLVDCGERAYVEDATRPAPTRTTATYAASTAPSPSRISVDFTDSPTATDMPAKPTTKPSATSRGSLLSGFVQLVLLIAALAVTFFAGRNWEQISAWISGQPATNQATPNTASTSTPIDPAFGDARAMFEARRYDKARDGLQELLKKDATNAEYHYWLGRAQLELKQPAEAIKHLNEAAKLNDKLPNVFVHLALAYEAAGDKKNAQESLRRATTITETPAPSPSSTPI